MMRTKILHTNLYDTYGAFRMISCLIEPAGGVFQYVQRIREIFLCRRHVQAAATEHSPQRRQRLLHPTQ